MPAFNLQLFFRKKENTLCIHHLKKKIHCNGIAPTKAEVYTLAAELQEIHEFKYFSDALISALKSYEYAYEYDDLSSDEKVIALLFLAAMYSE